MEAPGWQKALVVAGGAAATAGLLWYLFRAGDDDAEEGDEENKRKISIEEYRKCRWFKVTDKQGCSIGVRKGPDVQAERTGKQLQPEEVFPVKQILDASGAERHDISEAGDEQLYLLLADGRGWGFTRSSRDGRLLAEEIPPEQAKAEREAPRSKEQEFIQAMRQELENNPGLREQILQSQAMQGMMANPDQIQAAAESNPTVAEALQQQRRMYEMLASDPEALAQYLAAASQAQRP